MYREKQMTHVIDLMSVSRLFTQIHNTFIKILERAKFKLQYLNAFLESRLIKSHILHFFK